jgi:hypothetical protein
MLQAPAPFPAKLFDAKYDDNYEGFIPLSAHLIAKQAYFILDPIL